MNLGGRISPYVEGGLIDLTHLISLSTDPWDRIEVAKSLRLTLVCEREVLLKRNLPR